MSAMYISNSCLITLNNIVYAVSLWLIYKVIKKQREIKSVTGLPLEININVWWMSVHLFLLILS